MKIMTVGTGTCVPSAKRRSPSNYIAVGDKHFVVDAGYGTLRSLAEEKIVYSELNGIFFTHFHIDHIGELLSILNSLYGDYTVNTKHDFVLYGPVGLQKIVSGLAAVFDTWFPDWLQQIKVPVVVQELEHGDIVELSVGAKVHALHMPHLPHSLGYRFEDAKGHVVAFSGDTSYGQEVVELVKGADVAVLECSFSDETIKKNDMDKVHLSPATAGAIAQQAGVKKLVLSHINPIADQYPLKEQCNKVFNGEVVIAHDGMVLEVNG